MGGRFFDGRMRGACAAAAIACGGVASAWAQPAAQADKSGYSLLDPTPEALMRDLSTDRPGKSQGAITLDAGHVQLESDLVNDSFDHWSRDQTTTRLNSYAGPELKWGLTDWAEFDTVVPPYQTLEQRGREGGRVQRWAGFGDLFVGGKINLWGNAGGDTALAAQGFIRLPTGAAGLSDGKIEYTLTTPYVLALPDKFSLTLDPSFGVLRQALKPGYAGDAAFAVSLARPIIGQAVSAAVELFLDRSADRATGTRDTLDVSVQWQLGRDVQLDAATYMGLSKAAADIESLAGISVRY